jgi:hypothetical protein
MTKSYIKNDLVALFLGGSFASRSQIITTVSGITTGQTVELFNYLGQKVILTISQQPLANFDISNQSNGIYLIKILNKDGSIITEKKILKPNKLL